MLLDATLDHRIDRVIDRLCRPSFRLSFAVAPLGKIIARFSWWQSRIIPPAIERSERRYGSMGALRPRIVREIFAWNLDVEGSWPIPTA